MLRTRRTLLATALGVAALAVTAAFGPKDADVKAKIGEPAPAWTLKDLDNKQHNLKDFKGKTVVLEWTNPDCPWIVGTYEAGLVKDTLETMKELGKDEYVYIAVNSTANISKDEVVKRNQAFLKKMKTEIPAVIDYSGEIGKAYGAKTTPHMYIIDGEGILRYHGAFAERNFRTNDDATNYVVNALKKLDAGETVTPDYNKPWGCSVKYAK